jgi:hypothetical protein
MTGWHPRSRYVREITSFVRGEGNSWQRDDEHHENVLVDTSALPGPLAGHGARARVGRSFGTEELPPGLMTVTGERPA